MNIDTGYSPWEPSDDSVLLEEYHHYDMPLAGLIGQGPRRYLFVCLQGHCEDDNLWQYVSLDIVDLMALGEARTREVYEPLERELLKRNGWLVTAGSCGIEAVWESKPL